MEFSYRSVGVESNYESFELANVSAKRSKLVELLQSHKLKVLYGENVGLGNYELADDSAPILLSTVAESTFPAGTSKGG